MFLVWLCLKYRWPGLFTYYVGGRNLCRLMYVKGLVKTFSWETILHKSGRHCKEFYEQFILNDNSLKTALQIYSSHTDFPLF